MPSSARPAGWRANVFSSARPPNLGGRKSLSTKFVDFRPEKRSFPYLAISGTACKHRRASSPPRGRDHPPKHRKSAEASQQKYRWKWARDGPRARSPPRTWAHGRMFCEGAPARIPPRPAVPHMRGSGAEASGAQCTARKACWRRAAKKRQGALRDRANAPPPPAPPPKEVALPQERGLIPRSRPTIVATAYTCWPQWGGDRVPSRAHFWRRFSKAGWLAAIWIFCK